MRIFFFLRNANERSKVYLSHLNYVVEAIFTMSNESTSTMFIISVSTKRHTKFKKISTSHEKVELCICCIQVRGTRYIKKGNMSIKATAKLKKSGNE